MDNNYGSLPLIRSLEEFLYLIGRNRFFKNTTYYNLIYSISKFRNKGQHYYRYCKIPKKDGRYLTLYNQGHCLPQGACTSPALTNLILKNVDDYLLEYCKQNDITYTRYCDDLTFSSNKCVDVNHLIATVQNCLSQESLTLNHQKTRILKNHQRQVVTGIVVNSGLHIPRKTKKAIRQEMYYIMHYGIKAHLKHSGKHLYYKPEEDNLVSKRLYSNKYLQKLLGRVQYILSVEPHNQEFSRYYNFLKALKTQTFVNPLQNANFENYSQLSKSNLDLCYTIAQKISYSLAIDPNCIYEDSLTFFLYYHDCSIKNAILRKLMDELQKREFINLKHKISYISAQELITKTFVYGNPFNDSLISDILHSKICFIDNLEEIMMMDSANTTMQVMPSGQYYNIDRTTLSNHFASLLERLKQLKYHIILFSSYSSDNLYARNFKTLIDIILQID